MFSPVPALLAGLLLASAGASCSSVTVHTSGAPASAVAAAETYAWMPVGFTSSAALERGEEAALADRLRRLADAELEARGYRRVARPEADFWIQDALRVLERVTHSDPYYSYYTVNRTEQGALQVQLLDPADRSVLWQAEATLELRTVARGVGLDNVRWVPTGEERDWRLETAVPELFEDFPRR